MACGFSFGLGGCAVGIEVDSATAVTAAGGSAGLLAVVTWFLRTLNGQRTANQGIAAADVANQGNAALIEHYTKEVTRLNNVINDLSTRMDQIEKDKTLAEDNAHALDKQVALQDHKIGGLLMQIKTLNDQLRNREADLAAAEKRIGDLEKQIVNLERRRPDHAPRPEMAVPLMRRAEDKNE